MSKPKAYLPITSLLEANKNRHKQKLVDLSCPFRTSGLVPGAKLELVRKSTSPSVVSIALDVEGKRLTKQLRSDMTLWQVMRQFESSDTSVNMTGRASPKTTTGGETGSGQLYYEKPVVNIMGKDYSTQEELQKTLSQCGINSGSIALRVSFQKTDQTFYDAMQQIAQYQNEVSPEKLIDDTVPEPSVDVATTASQETGDVKKEELPENPTEPEPEVSAPVAAEEIPTDNVSKPLDASDDLMNVDQPTATAPPSEGHLEPKAIYSAPTSSTLAATLVREDDSVYEPTIAHAQLYQQRLLAKSQNTRLKSDEELAADAALEAEKLAKITKVEVKVRFPDQTSVQWEVHPDTTGITLYQSIRDVMANPDQPFKLVMSVAVTTIQENNKRLIADYRLKGRELLNLVWEDAASQKARSAPFLKSSVASKAKAVVVPEVPQYVQESGSAGGSSSNRPQKSQKTEHGMDSEALKKKFGKLFKLPGKK